MEYFKYLRTALCVSCLFSTQLSFAADTSPQPLARQEAASKAQIFYDVLVGELITNMGAPRKGSSLILTAAVSSKNEDLYQRACDIAIQAHDGNQALQAAQLWSQEYENSFSANRYLLQILLLLNRSEDTKKALLGTIKNAPTDYQSNIIKSIPSLYANTSKSIPMLEGVLKQYTSHAIHASSAWSSLGQIYLDADEQDKAFDAAQKSIAIDVDNKDAQYLLVKLIEKKSKSAENLIRTLVENHSDLHLALIKTLAQLNRTDEAIEEANRAFKKNPTDDLAIFLTQLNIKTKNLPEAEKILTPIIEKTENSTTNQPLISKLYFLQSEILRQQKKFTEAQDWLTKINGGDQLFYIKNQQAIIFADQGKISIARAIIQNYPATSAEEQKTKLLAEIVLLKNNNLHADAFETQKKLIEITPNDNELIYDLAITAEKIGNFQEMEKIIQGLIKKSPDFYHAYNLLGYSLADRNTKLQEAKTLINKALSIKPGDPFVTDSLGWVEFRLGNYQKSIQLLEDAYQKQPDPEIAAHLIEAYWLFGKKELAENLISKVKQQNSDHEALNKVILKIKNTKK